MRPQGRLRAALKPHQRGAYVNFLDRDDEARVRAAYGDEKYLPRITLP